MCKSNCRAEDRTAGESSRNAAADPQARSQPGDAAAEAAAAPLALKASARREPEHAPPGARAPPEAAQAQGLGELPGAVLLPVHHRGHGLGVLHDDGHLAVPLAQHAAVVDVGRAWGWGTTNGDASVL